MNTASASRILANTAWRALADAGSKVASVALYVVMARELGDAGFGVFTFAFMYVTIFTSLARFGQDTVLVREVARDHTLVDRYFANTVALKLALSVPVGALAIALLIATGASRETLAVAALLGAAVTVEAVIGTAFAVYQAFEELRWVAVVLIAQRFLTAAAGIAALLAGAGVVAVAAIYLGGALVALVLGLAIQFRRVARPRLHVAPTMWGALMRAAVPLGIAGVFGIILFRVDTVILAAFEPAAVVGDYGAAYRLFEATLFLGWSIGAAVYPVLSRLDDRKALATIYRGAVKLAVAATLPLAVGAAVLAEPLVELLYGAEFDEAATALQLLAPAIALFPVTYVTSLLLVARGRQRFIAVLYGAVTAVNIALNLVLIPEFSLNGAALATSLTEALVVLFSVALGVRLVGGISAPRVLAGPLVASATAGVAMALLSSSFWLAAAAGGLVYLAVLVLVERLAFPEDARAVWMLARRREVPA